MAGAQVVSRRKVLTGRTAQRGMSFPVVIDGDKYRQVANMVSSYRKLFREFDAMAAMSQAMTSRLVVRRVKVDASGKVIKPSKKTTSAKTAKSPAVAKSDLPLVLTRVKTRKKTAKQVKTEKRLRADLDLGAAKELLETLLGAKPRKAIYYEMRKPFMEAAEEIRKLGISLGSHIFDSLRRQVHAIRDKREPAYGRIPRRVLVSLGVMDLLPAQFIGVPFTTNDRKKKPDGGWTAGKRMGKFMKDDLGRLIIRLQWGHKEDYADFIVDGKTCGGAKTYSKKAADSQKLAFHKMYSGEWSYQTPVLNWRRDGSFSIHVPFRRLAPKDKNLDRDKVGEVIFQSIIGRDLPKKKNDTGRDDDKIFAIHAYRVDRAGRGKKQKCAFKQVFRIPVNDVVDQLRRFNAMVRPREVSRDTRRYWPRHLVEPLQKRVHGVTKQRAKTQHDANHVWSRRIVSVLASWGIGTIRVFGPPDGATAGLLGDGAYPWGWHDFVQKLTYKAEERGMRVEVVKSNKVVGRVTAQLAARKLSPTMTDQQAAILPNTVTV